MKTLFYLLLILLMICLIPGISGAIMAEAPEAEESKTEEIILRHLDRLELEELQSEINKLGTADLDLVPGLSLESLVRDLIRGDLRLDWRELGITLLRYLGQEVTVNFSLFGQIMLLAVISAILRVFYDSLSSSTISKTANLLVFLVLAILILQSFQLALGLARETVDNLSSFVNALLPVLIGLLLSMGAVTSAAIFHPLTFLLITVLANLVKSVILPLILMSAILQIVDNLSEEFRITRLASLFKESSLGLLGLMLIILVGGLLLQGGAAAVGDSLSLRTARYLAGTLIPVIGGIFSDAIDLIVTCSLVLKNALNFFGALIIILIVIYPLLKVLALIFIYKLAGALLQPIADTRIINILNDLGNDLVIIFLVMISVAFMLLVVITVVVGTANLTVMMR